MSGVLVGEVYDACLPGGKCEHLTLPEKSALAVIAEKCFPGSRQGSVPMSRIAGVLGVSERTARRVRDSLLAHGYITLIRRGYKAHGVTKAPVYELAGFLSALPL